MLVVAGESAQRLPLPVTLATKPSIRSGLPGHQAPARQRPQYPLAMVLQQDPDIPAADPGRFFGDQRGDQLRRHLMRPVQQRTQQTLAEPSDRSTATSRTRPIPALFPSRQPYVLLRALA